jgi:hypothetical protein
MAENGAEKIVELLDKDPAALLTEMYKELRHLRDDIQELKDAQKETFKDHEKRIADLEKFRYEVIGALIVIYTLIGWLIAIVR